MTNTEMRASALKNSVLIVAHPDDEILWFGSVAHDVDKIVICFLNDPAKPKMAEHRRQTLREHPWREKLVCLELDETRSFNCAEWPRPKISRFGLEIVDAPKVKAAYRKCAKKLRRQLIPIIQQADNVFTHNPWGEYGHEEHVLVHRVTTTLAQSSGKKTWYSNYASNWSEELMLRYLDKSVHTCFTGDVRISVVEEIADIYRANQAWTWLDDYAWFGNESFLQGPLQDREAPGAGWFPQVNMLELSARPERKEIRPRSFAQRVVKRLARL